ncbi:MAG: glycerol-3-phosphate acyltransferase [Eubacteriales bacterium]|nr:glycerol-3-phosphate acyltransferase [Eubacteriales bacterium]
MLWKELSLLLIGYLLGSILFSYHLPLWIRHVDIVKESGDHNPGTANAFRYGGVWVGILCLLLDLLKGAFPIWYALRLLGPAFPLLPFLMAAPVIGHATSPWYGFPGGKAIAAAFGVLIGLLPVSPCVYLLAACYLFFSLVWVIHPNERRSVVTFLCFDAASVALALWSRRFDVALGCVLLSVMPIYKNYVDIARARQAQMDKAIEPRSRLS